MNDKTPKKEPTPISYLIIKWISDHGKNGTLVNAIPFSERVAVLGYLFTSLRNNGYTIEDLKFYENKIKSYMIASKTNYRGGNEKWNSWKEAIDRDYEAALGEYLMGQEFSCIEAVPVDKAEIKPAEVKEEEFKRVSRELDWSLIRGHKMGAAKLRPDPKILKLLGIEGDDFSDE